MALPLRFATVLAPNMLPVYRGSAVYVGRALCFEATQEVCEDFGAFAADATDVGSLCGLSCVRLADEPTAPVEAVAALVLHGSRCGGRPVYCSDMVVRRDAPYRRFADLRDRVWAYNDPDPQSGYNVTRFRLLDFEQPAAYLGTLAPAGSHQWAMRMVAAGEVDAAIDAQVLAIEFRDHPGLAENLRVIDVLGPYTIQPMVASRRLPESCEPTCGRPC